MSDASFVAYCFSFFFLSWRFDSVIPKVFDLFKSVLTDNTLETGSDSLKATVSTALVGLLQSLRGLQVSAAFTSEQTNFDSLAKRVIQEKDLLSTFSDYFNDAPLKKGVAFLLQNAVRIPIGSNVVEAVREHKTWFILEEPAGGREIGACLFRLSRVLDKRSLGNYIGDLGREDIVVKEGENPGNVLGTVAFYNDQLQGFMHQFDFAGKSLLDSTREMVYSLCLPGEAQKIDRVMECFANHWYAQNSGGGQVLNPFRGSSGCFILAFAMIMLNTDQHSPSVKNRMTFREFVNMNRGIDDGESLPEDYLRVAYDDIKGHEIIMAEMMFKGFENNISWHLEMCTTTRNKYDCALAFIQVGEGAYVLSKPLVSEVVSSEFLNLVRPALLHANDILTRNEATGGLEKVFTAVSPVVRSFWYSAPPYRECRSCSVTPRQAGTALWQMRSWRRCWASCPLRTVSPSYKRASPSPLLCTKYSARFRWRPRRGRSPAGVVSPSSSSLCFLEESSGATRVVTATSFPLFYMARQKRYQSTF
ncbi:hypothetical protein AGDE_12679 [Angomonas deanei]|uniref:Sec7 domain containing protein, putative n=1 Tax=Angomonas deanei TaxID=59799 RepID=A0A7G2C5F4_9TRYP|nr:hypothetical protein AGDE_12679 [Angomonas deanei]CAD2214966.1 Sec7 domain containing protein, putative [Angomonas deanei]|eukprot:EPY23859.1 hypothetical protein AGDE_12679 [Angomonas deanei]